MTVAVIMAGGVGKRTTMPIPKQFVKVLGKPVLLYTLEVFQNHNSIDCIEIVCLKTYINYVKALVKQHHLTKVKWIVEGGHNFQYSVINGINHLEGKISDEDIILIHSGVSPLVSDDIIDDGIKVCKRYGNSSSTLPVTLLLGTNDGILSKNYVDRDKVVQLNSPLCLKFKEIKDLYKEAKRKNILDTVEPHPTSLMYYLGKKIYFSKGSSLNIKITTLDDLEFFECCIKKRQLDRGFLEEYSDKETTNQH